MEKARRTDRLGNPLRRHVAVAKAEGQHHVDRGLHRIRQIRRIGKLGQRGVERRQPTLTAERFGHRLLDQSGLGDNGDNRLCRCRSLKVEQRTGRRLLSKRLARLTGVRLYFVGHRRQRADRHGHLPEKRFRKGAVKRSVWQAVTLALSRPRVERRSRGRRSIPGSALVDQLRLASGQRLVDASARREAR